MKKISRIVWVVNLALLLVFFNWSVYRKEEVLANGQLILLKLAPKDPRSLMQGDFMRLQYEAAMISSDSIPKHGYIILASDSRQVGERVRIQAEAEPLQAGEVLLKYKTIDAWFVYIGAEAYFFEEGQGKVFEKAEYGGLKTDGKGGSILVGLYDKNLQLIIPADTSLN